MTVSLTDATDRAISSEKIAAFTTTLDGRAIGSGDSDYV